MVAKIPAEVYQAFMAGYVRRINDATLRVPIGGIKIGSAKYSRLAQINLESRVITFSRYAIENVPERGRRYLVIHELSHVIEPSHNQRFWETVARFEPNYKQVGRELELAFKRNVRESMLLARPQHVVNPLNGRLETPKLLLAPHTNLDFADDGHTNCESFEPEQAPAHGPAFDCYEEQLGSWAAYEPGIMCGGSSKFDDLHQLI